MALLRIESVKGEVGEKSNSGIYQKVRDGLFPRPVRIGQRAVGWPDYEVRAICNARIAGKSDAEIRALVIELHARRAALGNELLAPLAPATPLAHAPQSIAALA